MTVGCVSSEKAMEMSPAASAGWPRQVEVAASAVLPYAPRLETPPLGAGSAEKSEDGSPVSMVRE